MKKLFLMILFLSCINFCFSQNALEKISQESCHCIGNIESNSLPPEQVNRLLNICSIKAASNYEKELKNEFSINVRELFYTDQNHLIAQMSNYLMSNCPGYLTLLENLNQSYKLSDSLSLIYDENVLYLYGNHRFYKNGEVYNVKYLSSEFINSNEGLNEYIMFRNKSSKAGKLMIITFSSYIIAATQIGKNNTVAAGLGIIGFSANLLAIPISGKSTKHLQKSIWLRNRDELIQRFQPR